MSAGDDKAAAMRNEITSAIREATGLHERFANELSDEILSRLMTRWGGDRLHVPACDRAARDEAIRADFNGRNHDEVCRRHGISRRTLYRLIGERGQA